MRYGITISHVLDDSDNTHVNAEYYLEALVHINDVLDVSHMCKLKFG